MLSCSWQSSLWSTVKLCGNILGQRTIAIKESLGERLRKRISIIRAWARRGMTCIRGNESRQNLGRYVCTTSAFCVGFAISIFLLCTTASYVHLSMLGRGQPTDVQVNCMCTAISTWWAPHMCWCGSRRNCVSPAKERKTRTVGGAWSGGWNVSWGINYLIDIPETTDFCHSIWKMGSLSLILILQSPEGKQTPVDTFLAWLSEHQSKVRSFLCPVHCRSFSLNLAPCRKLWTP